MAEDGQLYEHVEEITENGQKYEHNKMSEEQCGIKRETTTVVSLLFIKIVIHCHCLALRTCVFSTKFISSKYLNRLPTAKYYDWPEVMAGIRKAQSN